MKKIGLALCYKIVNYGTVLQAFATQQILFRLGIDNVCVDYRKKHDFKTRFHYLHTLFIPYVLKMKGNAIRKSFREKISPHKLNYGFCKRRQAFSAFVSQNFTVTPPIVGYQNLEIYADSFLALLVGSDQVWHPLNLGSHFYTLEWGAKDQPRIAYASSFGVSNIPLIQRKKTVHYLNSFDFLSCREVAGKAIIKLLIGKTAEVVADPTLLHTAEEWNEMLHYPKRQIDRPYIFCYFLGNNPEHRAFAERLKRETNFRIVFLPHIDEIIESDMNFGDDQLFNVGPAEFFSLIKNANYVCTDSFHGTIFSILNRRKFITFNRYSQSNGSTNSRIDSLLSLLHLESQHKSARISVDDFINSDIDYESVFNILDTFRKKSLNYLLSALKETGCA